MEEELEELYGSNDVIERAVSYSRCSDFDRNGPKSLIKRTNVTGKAVTIGSLVDDLTIPPEDFVFDNNYLIFDGDKPTATTGKLVDIVLENYTEVPDEPTILEICRINEFWSRSKPETVLKSINESKFYEYLDVYFDEQKRNITNSSDYDFALHLSDILLNHTHTKAIFNKKYEHVHQYFFSIEHEGLVFRGKIDRVNIDFKNKTVEFIDLKTGAGDALEFTKSYIKYRYYLQEAIYRKAFDDFCNNYGLKGFTLLNFKFLYIGKSEQIPVILEVGEKWQKAALNGFTTSSGYKYRGLYEIIDEIKWHYKNKVFDIPRKIYENNGIFELEDDFINV